MKYSKEEINKIINLKDISGELINIFHLYGSLFLTELRTSKFKHTRFSSHTLPIIYEEFGWCETEEDVQNQFHESLEEAVKEKLV